MSIMEDDLEKNKKREVGIRKFSSNFRKETVTSRTKKVEDMLKWNKEAVIREVNTAERAD